MDIMICSTNIPIIICGADHDTFIIDDVTVTLVADPPIKEFPMIIYYNDMDWTDWDQCWDSDDALPESVSYIANHISTNVYAPRIRKKWD